MPSAPSTSSPREKTRIAGFFLPGFNEGSALLPGDRWIVRTAADILKTNRQLQKNIVRSGFFGALTLISVAAGTATLLLATQVLAVGVGVLALAAAVTCAQKTRGCWDSLKKETLPKIRAELAARYLKTKATQLADEVKRRVAEKQRAKQSAEKTASPDEEKKPVSTLSAKFSGWAQKRTAKKAQEPKSPPQPPPGV